MTIMKEGLNVVIQKLKNIAKTSLPDPKLVKKTA